MCSVLKVKKGKVGVSTPEPSIPQDINATYDTSLLKTKDFAWPCDFEHSFDYCFG